MISRRTFLHTSAAALTTAIIRPPAVYLPLVQGSGTVVFDTPSLLSAYASAPAGSVITLRGGLYTNKTTYWASPLRQCCFYLNKSITLEAYPGERPILTYTPGDPPLQDTSDWGSIVYVLAANVTLRGIAVVGTHSLGDLPVADTDVAVLVAGANAILDSCTILGWGHAGIKNVASGTVTVRDTTIGAGGYKTKDHCVYLATGAGHQIVRSSLAGAAGYGVHLYGTPSNTTVDSCLITDCGNGGMLLGGNGGHTVNKNTILATRGYGGLVLWKAASVGNAITDNVIIGNSTDVVLDQAGAPNIVSGNRWATLWTNTDYSAWPQAGSV